MVKVHFTVEVEEMDENLTLKYLRQIVDHLTDFVPQLGKGKLLTVMAEETLNHISCGSAIAESTSTMLPINSGHIYQNPKKNKFSEQSKSQATEVVVGSKSWKEITEEIAANIYNKAFNSDNNSM